MTYYRLYFFTPRTQGILKYEEFQASSDQEAMDKAETHTGQYAVELWSGGRRLAQFDADDLTSRYYAQRKQRFPIEAINSVVPIIVHGPSRA